MVFSISMKRLSGSWAWWVELGGEGGALVWCGSFNKRTPRYGGIPAKKAVCQFWRALLCKVVVMVVSELL